MNLQEYFPISSIPANYKKIIFLAASEGKLSLFSAIPPVPEKRGLNDIPSGPFKNPIVYRIFERMSSHDERILKQFMLELNNKENPEEKRALLEKSPEIPTRNLISEERIEDGPKLLRIDTSECGALAFYHTIFISRFIPPVEFLNKHGLDKLGFDHVRVAEAVPLLQEQGIMRRPFPVSISDVMLLKQETVNWMEENKSLRKKPTKGKIKNKSKKSNEIILVFWRAYCALKKSNEGEDPQYRQVWDAVYDEWYLKENEATYKDKLFPKLDYDIDQLITVMDSSDQPNPSVNWYIHRNESLGVYLMKSLPAKLSKLKKNPPF